MTPDDPAGHLQLCRELYVQLRRIQTHQEHKESAVSASLPINLSLFVRNLDLYLKWVERNGKVVDVAVRRPPLRMTRNNETA